jgi:hypothetical protein
MLSDGDSAGANCLSAPTRRCRIDGPGLSTTHWVRGFQFEPKRVMPALLYPNNTYRRRDGVVRLMKERCESAMREAVGLRQPCSGRRTSTRRNLLPKTKSTPRWMRRQSYGRRVAIVLAAFVVAYS